MLSPKVIKWLCHMFSDVVHRTNYEGMDNIKKDELYVFAANHVSSSDPVLIKNKIDNLAIMAKSELFKNSIIRYFIESAGAFPVNRDKKDFGGIIHASKQISSEHHNLLIFPEGTRKAAKKGVKAKDGAVCIARSAGVKIIPVYITENKGFFKKYTVKFGKPIDVCENQEKTNVKEEKTVIKEYTKKLMESIYDMRD